jgi:two-component system chemotaxis response regulator CheY
VKVLLVEDSTPLRGIIKQMLAQLGYDDIVEAADGLEAWDHLEGTSFGLLLTDWNMPNMSGFELLQLVRQTPQTAELPVVMLTTRSNKEDIISAVKAGVNNYVTKPCKPSDLKTRIDKAIRQQKEKPAKATVLPAGGDLVQAAEIIRGQRRFQPSHQGPCVLFYESNGDYDDLEKGRESPILTQYSAVREVFAKINAEYPGLEIGYNIETETKEILQVLAEKSGLVRMLMIAINHQSGHSLLRRLRFRVEDAIPTFAVCDSFMGLEAEQRDTISDMGVEILERRQLHLGSVTMLTEENAVPEVQTSRSGLAYLELKKGTGPSPTRGDAVTVHCVGRLQSGRIIVDTLKKGEPRTFQIGDGSVVAGMDEAVRMMQSEGRALAIVPPNLAYGTSGNGKTIPEDATISFQLQLLKVVTPPEDPLVK